MPKTGFDNVDKYYSNLGNTLECKEFIIPARIYIHSVIIYWIDLEPDEMMIIYNLFIYFKEITSLTIGESPISTTIDSFLKPVEQKLLESLEELTIKSSLEDETVKIILQAILKDGFPKLSKFQFCCIYNYLYVYYLLIAYLGITIFDRLQEDFDNVKKAYPDLEISIIEN